MNKTQLGFIGLGMMGKYMAKNLLKNNYPVIGYNRSKKVLLELKKIGLDIAETPEQVARQCDIIILMLPSSKETNEIMFGKDGLVQGLKKGSIIIDMSTSNPVETTKIMKKLKRKGIHMMDAPVSRGQKAAITGTLSIMVGGDKRYFKKCLPIFRAMGEYITYLGPFGSGMYVKSLNNFLFAMNLLASTQGLMIMKKNNIDFGKAVEVICESSGNNKAMCSSIKRNLGKQHPDIGFYLKHMAKDMKIFYDVNKNQKVSNVLAKPVLDYISKMSKTHGDEDAMYIFEHFLLKKKQ